ncbi:MAG: pitrilysin family protein [Leptospiraceae bacterium]|nr:pitrilysin family protein [Leptospiraceae bacterium]
MKNYLFILFLISFSLNADNIFQEAASSLRKNIKKTVFPNGLTLIQMKRSSSPTLALYTKFKVGSSDETPEIAGTAHMLEHMLFKGTTNVGTKNFAEEKKYFTLLKATGHELDQLKLEKRNLLQKELKVSDTIEKRIIELTRRLKAIEEKQKEFIIPSEDSYIYEQHGQVGFNAYTSYDVTNYQIKLPSNRLEIWAKMESDRLHSPILREYYTERDVIMEERRMRIENRGFGILREKFLSLAFDRSAYGRPVIGYESNIPFLDIYETENFFKEHYTPDNMVIAIVGDLEFEATEKIIEKYFGFLKPSNKKKEQRITEKSFLGEKRISFKHPGGSILMMGFHKPNYPHKDSIVFDLIDSILTRGASSRLYKEALQKEKLVSSISAWSSDPGERHSNLFTIFANLNSDASPEKLEEVIWKEIDKLKKGEFSEEEISRAKNNSTADFLREIDSNANLADGLTFYELLTNNWEDMFITYEKFNSVTKEDIQRIANKYFVKENSNIGFLDSRGTK